MSYQNRSVAGPSKPPQSQPQTQNQEWASSSSSLSNSTPLSTSNSITIPGHNQHLLDDLPSDPIALSLGPGSRPGSLRRRGRANGNGNELGYDHPLSQLELGVSPPGEDTRPSLKRLTSETEKRLEDAGVPPPPGPSGPSSNSGTMGRGSFEYRRVVSDRERDRDNGKGKGKEVEVEVLIHQVKANESIAGIALLYGIDLPTLRKTNKLWPSDPVHLRTHLYVPLEACKWNKASETLIRGPGEGQVTLTSKSALQNGVSMSSSKSRTSSDGLVLHRDDNFGSPSGVDALPPPPRIGSSGGRGGSGSSDTWMFKDPEEAVEILEDPWQSPSIQSLEERDRPLLDLSVSPNEVSNIPSTSKYNSSIGITGSSTSKEENPSQESGSHTRILDIVRLPASQLRFFPKASNPTPSEPVSRRTSFESDLRRTSLTMSRSASISRKVSSSTPIDSIKRRSSLSRDNNSSDPSLLELGGVTKKSNMIKIRPPTSQLPSTHSKLANRLSSLFIVPPPPLPGNSNSNLNGPTPGPGRIRTPNKPRISLDSARSGYSTYSAISISGLSSPKLLSRRSSLTGSGTSPNNPLVNGGNLGDELEMQVQGSSRSDLGDGDTFRNEMSLNGYEYGEGEGEEMRLREGRMSSDTLQTLRVNGTNGRTGGADGTGLVGKKVD